MSDFSWPTALKHRDAMQYEKVFLGRDYNRPREALDRVGITTQIIAERKQKLKSAVVIKAEQTLNVATVNIK